MATTSFEYGGVQVTVRERREIDNLLSPTLSSSLLEALGLTFDDAKARPALWVRVSFFVSVMLQAVPSAAVAWWAASDATVDAIASAYRAFWSTCEEDDALLSAMRAAFERVEQPVDPNR